MLLTLFYVGDKTFDVIEERLDRDFQRIAN